MIMCTLHWKICQEITNKPATGITEVLQPFMCVLVILGCCRLFKTTYFKCRKEDFVTACP